MSNTPEILVNALPNIDAHITRDADGNFAAYELYPHSGYVIHDPNGDFNGPGPDGTPVYEPYYTYGGSSIIEENYDWETNPYGFEAVPCCKIKQNTEQLLL